MRKFVLRILEEAVVRLNDCIVVVNNAAMDEAATAERLPGNLKESSKYDNMVDNATNMKIAASQINSAVNNINIACGNTLEQEADNGQNRRKCN